MNVPISEVSKNKENIFLDYTSILILSLGDKGREIFEAKNMLSQTQEQIYTSGIITALDQINTPAN